MDLPFGTVPWGPALRWEDFLGGVHEYLARKCSKNAQSAIGPTQCKSSPGNGEISRPNHLFYHFLITIQHYLASFYATKYFEKKLAWGNAH